MAAVVGVVFGYEYPPEGQQDVDGSDTLVMIEIHADE